MCGPGPGIVGSSSPLGHGGMVALDSAHCALALGCPTLVVARMSSGDARARHRGLSHHTLTVLELLLAGVTVAFAANGLSPFGEEGVHEMQRIGMLVDISHVSDDTFWSVMKVAKAPVIASHFSAGQGADYIFFGPIFATPSKAAMGAPQGVTNLAEVCRSVAIPVGDHADPGRRG